MKIAMIGHKRIPSREGGVEIVVNELSTRMATLGNKVCAYNRNIGEPRISNFDGVRVVEIRTPKKQGLNALVYSFCATVKALFGHYNVIHYHAEGSCSMLFIAHMFKIPTVATIHGLDWQRAKWGGFAKKYLMFGEKMAARYADEIIVLSGNMHEYFKRTYDRDTVLIPNGIIPTSRQEPNIILKKYGVCGHDYVLFLARLTPEKGLHYLIDAFSKIETDKKLIIAGRDDPETDYIKDIKNQAASDPRIVFAGLVQGDELVELFSNCYVYCLPSDIEGMPISLLEAVSFRARCLVSDIPENTEVTDGYAHTFKAGDKDDLCCVLRDIIAKQAYYDTNFITKSIPQSVETQIDNLINSHNWDIIVDRTLELYKSAINRYSQHKTQ